jgi:hypothetical protein
MVREDGELAFETFPGIYREEAIMLLREFYMQTNKNGLTLRGPLADDSTESKVKGKSGEEEWFR